ncbi:MAG TPA: hypothetical protein VIH38_08670, partial [Steroidobacteraceae bacterium]
LIQAKYRESTGGLHPCGETPNFPAFNASARTSHAPWNEKRPRGFPAGAIPTVDFLLHHLAAAVKKTAVKTHDL